MWPYMKELWFFIQYKLALLYVASINNDSIIFIITCWGSETLGLRVL
jgi:hypothetical protein